MPSIVTLEFFSGRENPSWELDDRQIEELQALLAVERDATILKPSTVLSRLGYRGFKVESNREPLPALLSAGGGVVEESREAPSIADGERTIERFLLETGQSCLDPRVVQIVEKELEAASHISGETDILVAPPYNPGKWNNDPTILARNNCYNYGCDKITNTRAQPGLGSGRRYSTHDCNDVASAARRDGLSSVPGATGNPPPNSHYVALVMAPGLDYHWYRFDANGRWSHKAGSTPATDRDHSGRVILNPETADRHIYTDFCGYFLVNIANLRIE